MGWNKKGKEEGLNKKNYREILASAFCLRKRLQILIKPPRKYFYLQIMSVNTNSNEGPTTGPTGTDPLGLPRLDRAMVQTRIRMLREELREGREWIDQFRQEMEQERQAVEEFWLDR